LKRVASRPMKKPELIDSLGDGTPDFLRLDSGSDRDAFRAWFTLLADYESLRPTAQLPVDIRDCAGLLRYCYRNALHAHDESWFSEARVEGIPALPGIQKYQYHFTPLHAALFRVKPGAYVPGEEKTAFTEFADVETLIRFNTFFVSRDIQMAQPGDLLFYRQLDQNSPYHSMIFVGRSVLETPLRRPETDVVVYHTGPIHKLPGEMRRLSVADLLRHPSPRWRPLPGNSNFLGIYRWNILKEAN
ncbi:MAG TPA: DUF1175 family protein, partial [Terriglobales bacterium]